MKMFKTISMFILLFTGSLLNAQDSTTPYSMDYTVARPFERGGSANHDTTQSSDQENNHIPGRGLPTLVGRGLPTLVVAGVSIALVLLFILIVAVFWYGWKKSQEGSIEINPIPYGEPGVSLQTVSVPEN